MNVSPAPLESLRPKMNFTMRGKDSDEDTQISGFQEYRSPVFLCIHVLAGAHSMSMGNFHFILGGAKHLPFFKGVM
jgi:hypothetical protein